MIQMSFESPDAFIVFLSFCRKISWHLAVKKRAQSRTVLSVEDTAVNLIVLGGKCSSISPEIRIFPVKL